MLAGALTKARAMDLVDRGIIDLAASGQPYVANPDPVERLRRDIPLATPYRATCYGSDALGYTSYPTVGSHPQ